MNEEFVKIDNPPLVVVNILQDPEIDDGLKNFIAFFLRYSDTDDDHQQFGDRMYGFEFGLRAAFMYTSRVGALLRGLNSHQEGMGIVGWTNTMKEQVAACLDNPFEGEIRGGEIKEAGGNGTT